MNRDLRWMWFTAEALLVATMITSLLMLQRVFEDNSFVSPMVFTVLVGHGALIAMRWFGFGAFLSGLVSLLATAMAIVATHYADTAAALVLPTSATVDQVEVDIDAAQLVFESLQAPVPSLTGFVVIGSLVFWFFGFAADWAAFRLFSPGQAVAPTLTVLIFVSLLGVEENRLSTTTTWLVVAVLFVLSHRAAARTTSGIWLDEGPSRGYVSLMAAGGIVTAIAALVGVMGSPAVPGADQAPLLEIGEDGRNESRPIEVVSPLVQIQPRLVEQSNDILFTVESDERAYWRIAALDVFDGFLWRSQGQFRDADDDLGVAYETSAPMTVINQTVEILSLNAVWAPAAYLPTEVQSIRGAGLNYEAESATFIVDTEDQRTSNGLVYQVESRVPAFTADMLTGLPSGADEVDPRYLELPADYSPLAIQTAQQVTAGLNDPYSQALALQNYFRDNFIYDLDVAKGHDISRLEDFLTVQRGYCEQFAGTFASMARAIGLPSRVATGFTPGDPDPNNPGRFLVRGTHAHAWPEVYISGAGWVAFEPTPGRGAPNASDYTGVPEAQAVSEAAAAEAPDGSDLQQEQAQPVPPELQAPTPTPVPPQQLETEPLQGTPVELLAADDGGIPRSALILLAAIAAALAWFFGVPALKRSHAARLRARMGDDNRRLVTLAWARTVDELERHGRGPAPTETMLEYADVVRQQFPDVANDFGELSDLAVGAAYDAAAPSESNAERARLLEGLVTTRLMAAQPWLVRSAHDVNPLPLLRGGALTRRADELAAGADRTPAP